MKDRKRIVEISIADSTIKWLAPEIEHERRKAIEDLLKENSFVLIARPEEGAYSVRLSIRDNRLHLDVSGPAEEPAEGAEPAEKTWAYTEHVTIPASPFRNIVKDYFLICESYFKEMKQSSPARMEAIDMGRRGVHNEGAKMLTNMLKKSVELDFETARRLFTLICVLHIRG